MPFTRYSPAQTLIETLAAIFILTMGVTAGVGLANYALGTSTSITKQFIATGLAREGLEAIKEMRDSNWLQAGAISNNCYDYANPSANDAKCYKNWLTVNNYNPVLWGVNTITSTINPPASPTNYILSEIGADMSPAIAGAWVPPYMDWEFYQTNNSIAVSTICPGNVTLSYGLDFQANPLNDNPFGEGYYTPTCNSKGSSGFYRQIILSAITKAPFNESDSNNDMAELYVQSRVWWTDNKFCPPSATYPGQGKCSVELDTYLTNWKNY